MGCLNPSHYAVFPWQALPIPLHAVSFKSAIMIRSIIVDDEKKSRENLKVLITDFCQGVEVLEMCQDVDEALQVIPKLKPDVVFLDIQLRKETGFDLLEKLKNVEFEIIFTTAYSEYDTKAFRFAAIDYLMKPIHVDELRSAIERLQKRMGGNITDRLQHLVQNMSAPSTEHFKIAIPTTEGLLFVKVTDILYCIASGNYTEIVMADRQQHMVTRTLKEYEDILEGQEFFRIHHSYLINLRHLKKYVRGDGGYVVMNDDKSLDVSKRKKDGFLVRIGAREEKT